VSYDRHEMGELIDALKRWGRYLEKLREWHGYPQIENCYKAFFGPSARHSQRIPIPDMDSEVVVLNAKILCLGDDQFEAIGIWYGLSVKETGGYWTGEEKARLLQIPFETLRSRVKAARMNLLRSHPRSATLAA
jgi:hypothetical protein